MFSTRTTGNLSHFTDRTSSADIQVKNLIPSRKLFFISGRITSSSFNFHLWSFLDKFIFILTLRSLHFTCHLKFSSNRVAGGGGDLGARAGDGVEVLGVISGMENMALLGAGVFPGVENVLGRAYCDHVMGGRDLDSARRQRRLASARRQPAGDGGASRQSARRPFETLCASAGSRLPAVVVVRHGEGGGGDRRQYRPPDDGDGGGGGSRSRMRDLGCFGP
ncbi:hypothetical protein ZWY2020_022165 [Hordeum vulgare]|nr:hypothetical protein ZWY2020_022165 [Hordeum vulgare]